MTARDLHRRWCSSCRSGETWPIGWWHRPVVTTAYEKQREKEQLALAAHRSEQDFDRQARKAVMLVAVRGGVSGE